MGLGVLARVLEVKAPLDLLVNIDFDMREKLGKIKNVIVSFKIFLKVKLIQTVDRHFQSLYHDPSLTSTEIILLILHCWSLFRIKGLSHANKKLFMRF